MNLDCCLSQWFQFLDNVLYFFLLLCRLLSSLFFQLALCRLFWFVASIYIFVIKFYPVLLFLATVFRVSIVSIIHLLPFSSHKYLSYVLMPLSACLNVPKLHYPFPVRNHYLVRSSPTVSFTTRYKYLFIRFSMRLFPCILSLNHISRVFPRQKILLSVLLSIHPWITFVPPHTCRESINITNVTSKHYELLSVGPIILSRKRQSVSQGLTIV